MSAASDELGDRIRAAIGHRPGVTEKRMFGGIGFMRYGNMVVAAMKSGELLMRVGPDLHAQAVARPGAAAMVQGGREMKGFVIVANDAIEDDDHLNEAIAFAWSFVATLAAKDAAPPVRKAAAKSPKTPAKR
jgi:TfoX/Sxy family transcriptional regulator of competence genes